MHDFAHQYAGDSHRSITKEKTIRKVTWSGLLINILLSAFKIVAGIWGRSQAVVADGIHSLSDTTTDIAVIVGSYFWTKPPDMSHPYGHQRIETIVSLFIGVVIFVAGVGIGAKAILTLHHPCAGPPGWIALLAAFLSIVCKEALYQWTAAVGNRIKSLSLAANAWHHRLDAISSIPVLIAVGAAILWPDWKFIDHMGAAFVSLLIMYAALKIFYTGLQELLDGGAPRETCEKIRDLALEHPSVHQVYGIRTRYAANSLKVDLKVVVDGDMTVSASHQVAEDIENRILNDGPDIVDVVVHIEPLGVAVPEDQCVIKPRGDLVKFFRKSPLSGVSLDVARDKSGSRDVEL